MQVYTTQEVADLLKVKPRRVRELVYAGTLKEVPGVKGRFAEWAVESLLTTGMPVDRPQPIILNAPRIVKRYPPKKLPAVA